jgi:hypothetical protein
MVREISRSDVPEQRQACEINESDDCWRDTPAASEVFVLDSRSRDARLRGGLYACRPCVEEMGWSTSINAEIR